METKLEQYEDHVEIRFHRAKTEIMSQLEAIIKINLNLAELCNDICVKHEIQAHSFKTWVQEQIPSILAVEDEDDEDDED